MAGEWIMWIRVAALCVFLLCGFWLKDIGIGTDYRLFFGDNNPDLIALGKFEQTFGKSDSAFVAISSNKGDILDARSLKVLRELESSLSVTPYIISTASVLSVESNMASDLGHSAFYGTLLNEEHSSTGVLVTIDMLPERPNAVVDSAEFILDIVNSYREKYPELRFDASGIVMMNHAFAENLIDDLMLLVPLSNVVMFLMLLLIFRSILLSCYVLGIAVFSNTIALGWATYMGIQLTPPSGMASIIVLTLAVASCVHVINAIPKAGESWQQRISQAVILVREPVLLACLTTVIGFLCLNFNETPPYRDLGNITAVGIVSVAFASLILFPWLLSLRGLNIRQKNQSNWLLFTSLLFKYKVWVVVALPLVLAIGMVGLLKLEINDKFSQWFDEDTAFRVQADFISDNLTGMYSLELQVKPRLNGAIGNSEFWSDMTRLHEHYIQDRNVWAVKSLVNGVAGDRHTNLDGVLTGLSSKTEASNFIDGDAGSTRMTIIFKQADSKYILAMTNTLTEQVKRFEYIELERVVGPAVMFANLTERNLRDMMTGLLAMLTSVVLLFIVLFRDIKLSILALLANILPILAGFCIWALFNSEVGLAVSIVASCALGIIVDDTIHLLYHLRKFRSKYSDPKRALSESLMLSGQAIVITTIVLTLGFSVLLYSDFLLNVTFAYLTITMMLCALVFDLIFLPALILVIDSWRSRVKTIAWN